MSSHDELPDDRAAARQVVADCLQAYRVCQETASYGLDRAGALAEPALIRLLRDCADVNLATANLLTRASPFGLSLATLCADVSRACAEAMESSEHANAQLRASYAACRRAYRGCAEWTGALPRADPDVCDDILRASFPASDPPPSPGQI